MGHDHPMPTAGDGHGNQQNCCRTGSAQAQGSSNIAQKVALQHLGPQPIYMQPVCRACSMQTQHAAVHCILFFFSMVAPCLMTCMALPALACCNGHIRALQAHAACSTAAPLPWLIRRSAHGPGCLRSSCLGSADSLLDVLHKLGGE